MYKIFIKGSALYIQRQRRTRRTRIAAPAAADRGHVDGEVEVVRVRGKGPRRIDDACAGRAARRLLVDLVVAGGRARAHELVHAVAALGVGDHAAVEALELPVVVARAGAVVAGFAPREHQRRNQKNHGGLHCSGCCFSFFLQKTCGA